VNESRTNESYLRMLYVCPILGIARSQLSTHFEDRAILANYYFKDVTHDLVQSATK